MSDSNDPFGVFSASPSLPGLDPASYVARFDAPERGPASDADPRPPSGLYRLRAAERYDERGFPPALAAQVRGLRASVR